MDRKIIKAAAILGFIAIAFGAFGAHTLKKLVGISELNTFETGVRYQMYHSLFLLFIGTTNKISEATKKSIYYFVWSGVILFSGSLYFLALNDFLRRVTFKMVPSLKSLTNLTTSRKSPSRS